MLHALLRSEVNSNDRLILVMTNGAYDFSGVAIGDRPRLKWYAALKYRVRSLIYGRVGHVGVL